MKRLIAFILAVLMMAVVFAGCDKNENGINNATVDEMSQTQENSVQTEFNLTLNAFTMNGVEHSFLVDDAKTDMKAQKINTISFVANTGETVLQVLSNNGYSNFKVDETLDEFLGFMEYKIISSENEDGTVAVTYEKMSGDTLYTAEELLEKEITDYSVTYVAKWKSLTDDYYAAFGY